MYICSFGLTTVKITGLLGSTGNDIYYYPLEHGLAMVSIIVVAGAFLQYVTNDEKLSRSYILIGLAVTVVALAISFSTWPDFARSEPGIHFNETWESLLIHILSIILILVAIFVLMKKAREAEGFSISTVSVFFPFSFWIDEGVHVSSTSGSLLRAVKSASSSPLPDSQ